MKLVNFESDNVLSFDKALVCMTSCVYSDEFKNYVTEMFELGLYDYQPLYAYTQEDIDFARFGCIVVMYELLLRLSLPKGESKESTIAFIMRTYEILSNMYEVNLANIFNNEDYDDDDIAEQVHIHGRMYYLIHRILPSVFESWNLYTGGSFWTLITEKEDDENES